jgi:hypothetical protein
MLFKVLALAAAVSITLPAVAQTADPDATASKKEKKTCRREAVTGSIVGTRAICHTVTEWAAIDKANAQNADGMLDDSRLRSSYGK